MSVFDCLWALQDVLREEAPLMVYISQCISRFHPLAILNVNTMEIHGGGLMDVALPVSLRSKSIVKNTYLNINFIQII